MSVGLICTCREPIQHATRSPVTGQGCGMYAAEQLVGGPCRSCAAGWHQPCEMKVKPGDFGTCPTCHYHVSMHEGYR